jgi:hypothetical protein
VTVNGRCTGNVYEWCDYFSQEIHSLDCNKLGMTCRADPSEPNEFDTNGCVGAACTDADEHCDGQLMFQCHADKVIATDCSKWVGASGVCIQPSTYTDCSGGPPCSPKWSHSCDGSVLRVCSEDGNLNFRDCAREVPSGICVEVDASTVTCGGVSIGFAH